MFLCHFVLICFAYLASSKNLTCLDRKGDSVPWFTFVKYPGNISTNGSHFAYLDSNQGSAYQIISGVYADGYGEALPSTIHAINTVPEEDFSLLIFNDEPPNVPYDPFGGHAKGIIAFDHASKSGVYIMHSLPKFPNVNATSGYIDYTFPDNTFEYAQNAYCISIDEEILGHLINNLPVEWPNAYFSSGIFTNMTLNSTNMSAVSQFNLLNGDEQWFLTKSPNTTLFLYEGIIGPYFQTGLAVESWGRPYQDPDCPPKSSDMFLNIDQIAFSKTDTWDHYSDHSKWAISVGDDLNLACLCDMNRMDTQQIRGGSCLCSRNSNLYTALRAIAVAQDNCNSMQNSQLTESIVSTSEGEAVT